MKSLLCVSAGGQRQTDWKNQRLRFCELQRSKWLRESHERDERWVSSHRLSLQLLLQGICCILPLDALIWYHPGTLTVLSLSVFVQGSTLVAVPSNWGRACGRTATLKWFARNKKRRRNWASDSFQQVCVFVCGLKARLWDHDPVHGLITFCFPSKIKPIFLRCLRDVLTLYPVYFERGSGSVSLWLGKLLKGLYNNDLVQYTIELEPIREGSADHNSKAKEGKILLTIQGWRNKENHVITTETQAYVWMFLTINNIGSMKRPQHVTWLTVSLYREK